MSTVNIANLDLQGLYTALVTLDGQRTPFEVVADGKKTTTVELVPYVFPPAVRLAIAQNLTVVKNALREFAHAHDALVKQYATSPANPEAQATDENGNLRVHDDNLKVFADDLTALRNTEVMITLQRFPADSLNLDRNSIPGSVLAELTHILV